MTHPGLTARHFLELSIASLCQQNHIDKVHSNVLVLLLDLFEQRLISLATRIQNNSIFLQSSTQPCLISLNVSPEIEEYIQQSLLPSRDSITLPCFAPSTREIEALSFDHDDYSYTTCFDDTEEFYTVDSDWVNAVFEEQFKVRNVAEVVPSPQTPVADAVVPLQHHKYSNKFKPLPLPDYLVEKIMKPEEEEDIEMKIEEENNEMKIEEENNEMNEEENNEMDEEEKVDGNDIEMKGSEEKVNEINEQGIEINEKVIERNEEQVKMNEEGVEMNGIYEKVIELKEDEMESRKEGIEMKEKEKAIEMNGNETKNEIIKGIENQKNDQILLQIESSRHEFKVNYSTLNPRCLDLLRLPHMLDINRPPPPGPVNYPFVETLASAQWYSERAAGFNCLEMGHGLKSQEDWVSSYADPSELITVRHELANTIKD